MTTKSLFWTGIIGAALAILCCATPVLIILLGAVGLSALTGYLDYVLLPAVTVFAGIFIYALWRRKPA
jgi:mercuric ion transport protein